MLMMGLVVWLGETIRNIKIPKTVRKALKLTTQKKRNGIRDLPKEVNEPCQGRKICGKNRFWAKTKGRGPKFCNMGTMIVRGPRKCQSKCKKAKSDNKPPRFKLSMTPRKLCKSPRTFSNKISKLSET